MCDRRSKQAEFVGQYGAKGILYRLVVSGLPDLDRLVRFCFSLARAVLVLVDFAGFK